MSAFPSQLAALVLYNSTHGLVEEFVTLARKRQERLGSTQDKPPKPGLGKFWVPV